MIYVDTTRTAGARHRSGLLRVNERLLQAWGAAACAVHFDAGAWWRGGEKVNWKAEDWLFTAELFSRQERPQIAESLSIRPARTAALFHDAIPLKRPDITWPQSVARHPDYMKLLSRFDRVFAVSRASRDELEGYWRWLRLASTPEVLAVSLGADLEGVPRVISTELPAGTPEFLSVGILEPRKNQALLLDVAEALWTEGHAFALHLAGRVNPHFGAPLAQRIRSLRARGFALQHHESLGDDGLPALYRRARIHFFPTQAEGCGLPLLESLWLGTPVFCSDLPVLRENADAGGCVPLPLHDPQAWRDAWLRALSDEAWVRSLRAQAVTRALPTWRETADSLRKALTGA